ncbi:hypothetical protein IscW_ISCW020497 [Ixodes scapularis]|uniref:Uncharacterized protein n=1 Tax=Ixodes scapularis TaxID=6945 RepID=B7Q186_IXOSC|nr:hypothetical protein IscW_ISCW020497 [Ixodes scapularis]|eukprot:XP_002409092.1 hypothetical protein IscW_ISCW020497 [Ixodes scapularis]
MNARTWAAATFCSYGCGRRSEAFLLRPVIPTTEPGGDLVFFVTASFAGTKKAPEASPGSRREAAFEALRSEASTRSRVESRVGSGDRGPLCLGRGAHSRLDRQSGPTADEWATAATRAPCRLGDEWLYVSACGGVDERCFAFVSWPDSSPGRGLEGGHSPRRHSALWASDGAPLVRTSARSAAGRAEQSDPSGVPAPGSRPERQVRDADPGPLEESNTRHAALGTQPDRLVTKAWDHGKITSSESGSSLVASEKGLAKRAFRQAYSKHQEDTADGKKRMLSTQTAEEEYQVAR